MRNEDRSEKLEERVSEPLRDRNKEFFSPRLDAEPSEPVKVFPILFI